MATHLNEREVGKWLAAHSPWALQGNLIERTFVFRDFVASMKFVNQLAVEAERTQHHPDIKILYSKVTLGFSTHDAGGITEKDFAGAAFADAVFAAPGCA